VNNFAEGEKGNREFYKKLSGNERLQILVELLNHAPEQRLERLLELLSLRGVDYVIIGAHNVSKDALIRNKRAVGWQQDLADLGTLEG
jgi:hypothetical protein